eukprot:2119862-Pyramimonas_sp.AAC.2
MCIRDSLSSPGASGAPLAHPAQAAPRARRPRTGRTRGASPHRSHHCGQARPCRTEPASTMPQQSRGLRELHDARQLSDH